METSLWHINVIKKNHPLKKLYFAVIKNIKMVRVYKIDYHSYSLNHYKLKTS